MLCGEFHRAPLGLNLSLSVTRSPYTSLLALVQGMAAITAHAAHEDEDIFLGKHINNFIIVKNESLIILESCQTKCILAVSFAFITTQRSK